MNHFLWRNVFKIGNLKLFLLVEVTDKHIFCSIIEEHTLEMLLSFFADIALPYIYVYILVLITVFSFKKQEFFVADATEDQVFVCACINSTSTNLYISGSRGTEYSLSLENIMYYSPSLSYSWLSWVFSVWQINLKLILSTVSDVLLIDFSSRTLLGSSARVQRLCL